MKSGIRINSGISIKQSPTHGMGVFASRDFKKGELVYKTPRGNFVKMKDVKNLSLDDKEHLDRVDKNTYELMREPARFVNHSCEPNIFERIMPDGIYGYANQDIVNGEELGVDYRIRAHDDWTMECFCGAKSCAGIVKGNFFSLSARLQKKYLPFAPTFIQAEYVERQLSGKRRR